MEQQLGQNIVATLEGDILTLRIDLSKQIGPSASGKSVLIASTNGNTKLPGGESIGVNCYRKHTAQS